MHARSQWRFSCSRKQERPHIRVAEKTTFLKAVRSLPGSRIHLKPSGDSRKQSYSCALFCRRFWFQVTKQRQIQTSTCCQSSRLTEPVYLLILNGWLQTSGDTFNTVTVKYTQGDAKQMAGGHMDNSKHVASEYLDTQVLEVWFKMKADVTCGNEQRVWFYTTKIAENLQLGLKLSPTVIILNLDHRQNSQQPPFLCTSLTFSTYSL